MMSRYQELERQLAALPAAEQAQWITRFLARNSNTSRRYRRRNRPRPDGWIAGRKPSRAPRSPPPSNNFAGSDKANTWATTSAYAI